MLPPPNPHWRKAKQEFLCLGHCKLRGSLGLESTRERQTTEGRKVMTGAGKVESPSGQGTDGNEVRVGSRPVAIDGVS